jgi:hypothetical protein
MAKVKQSGINSRLRVFFLQMIIKYEEIRNANGAKHCKWKNPHILKLSDR